MWARAASHHRSTTTEVWPPQATAPLDNALVSGTMNDKPGSGDKTGVHVSMPGHVLLYMYAHTHIINFISGEQTPTCILSTTLGFFFVYIIIMHM